LDYRLSGGTQSSGFSRLSHMKGAGSINIIKEFNGFYARLEYEPVSANAVALWFGLLYIANRSRWRAEFTVDNATLAVRSRVSERALMRARRELVQKGYIVYAKGHCRVAPARYSLPLLYEDDGGAREGGAYPGGADTHGGSVSGYVEGRSGGHVGGGVTGRFNKPSARVEARGGCEENEHAGARTRRGEANAKTRSGGGVNGCVEGYSGGRDRSGAYPGGADTHGGGVNGCVEGHGGGHVSGGVTGRFNKSSARVEARGGCEENEHAGARTQRGEANAKTRAGGGVNGHAGEHDGGYVNGRAGGGGVRRGGGIYIKQKNIENKKHKQSVSEADALRPGRFVKPGLEEVRAYCAERGRAVDPERFYDFYESKGWKVGHNDMTDWRACARGWERNGGQSAPKAAGTAGRAASRFSNFKQRKWDFAAIETAQRELLRAEGEEADARG